MKKIGLSLLIALSCATISVYSQTFTLDHSFGQNGMTIIPNTSDIHLFDFDRQGNIVAAGCTYIDISGKNHLTIAKTSADGMIDESFGSHGLVKVTDYDTSWPLGLKITKDNKIVLIGSFEKVQFKGSEIMMMRFNEDGSVDETFGDKGKVSLGFSSLIENWLNMENDDFMLVVGYDVGDLESNSTEYSVSKYNYEGVLDESFGTEGSVLLPNSISPFCMKILNKGSIIVAGTYVNAPSTFGLGLCKLTPDGELDTDFADNGIWYTDVVKDSGWTHESITHILEDSIGNLILSGPWPYILGEYSLLTPFLSKISSDGILDTSFGDKGFYWFDFSYISGINQSVLQIGDYYIISGWGGNQKILCVKSDGTSSGGIYTGGIYYVQDFKRQGDNQIIIGGGYQIENSPDIADFALERITFNVETTIEPVDYSSNGPFIFPNPAKETLYFSDETAFEIFDMQGNILLKSETSVQSVPIGNLRAGVYFVRLGNKIHKLIKK